MNSKLDVILTIISFICMISSIIGALRANAYAKKAKALLIRDSIKTSLNQVLELKGYIDCIRNYKNPALETKPPRGHNIEMLINEQISMLKKQFDYMTNSIPTKYQNILVCENVNQMAISKIIAHMLSDSDEITDSALDKIEFYFSILEKELKKADEQETNILN